MPQVVTQNVTFEHVSAGTRGNFQLQFSIQNRGIFYNQQLVLNLAMLDAANNKAANTNCAVYNIDGSASFVWRSM